MDETWGLNIAVLLLGDLDLPLRGRIYREPQGRHVAVVRGADLELAFEHVSARPDCRGLAVLGAPEPRGLGVLRGKRVLVTDGDRSRMWDFAQAGLRSGADVEWIHAAEPPLEKLAEWALPVAGVVLAAGAATRMGSQKLLLEVQGRPVIEHVIGAAREGGCHGVVVVHSDPVVLEAVGEEATCVLNPDAASGMASSLRAGLQALSEDMAGALMLLGDQPLVGSRTVSMLLRAWRREGARPAMAAAFRRGKQWLPPVVLERSLWPALAELRGDAGARQVLDRHPELLDTVPASGLPDDIDTPQDYDKILRLFPRRDPG